MSALQNKVELFPNFFNLICGFIHVHDSELSSPFPISLFYIILSFYGTTIDIINEANGHSIKMIMPLKRGYSFNFYFNKVKIQKKLTIGFVNNYQEINQLHQMSSFAGLLFTKYAHWLWKTDQLLGYNVKCLQPNEFLKISFTFKEDRKISYAICQDGEFPNQFMYHRQKSAIGKEILSSQDITVEEKPKKDDQFLCIEFCDYNDSLSITNITKKN